MCFPMPTVKYYIHFTANTSSKRYQADPALLLLYTITGTGAAGARVARAGTRARCAW